MATEQKTESLEPEHATEPDEIEPEQATTPDELEPEQATETKPDERELEPVELDPDELAEIEREVLEEFASLRVKKSLNRSGCVGQRPRQRPKQCPRQHQKSVAAHQALETSFVLQHRRGK